MSNKKPHSHAKVLIWIADGLQIQSNWASTDWIDIAPYKVLELISQNWKEACFRLKRHTHYINGIECPAPEEEAPKVGTQYWVPSFLNLDFALALTWLGYEQCVTILNRGLVHLTKEAAVENAKAMLEFTCLQER